MKLDSSGEVEWFNRYGGSEDDSLDDVVALSDGSCIVVGSSESSDGDVSSNHGGQDFWIFKLTADGNVVWSVNYGGSHDDKAKALIMAQNDKIVVLGQSQSWRSLCLPLPSLASLPFAFPRLFSLCLSLRL
ncbi:MAG: hypothetical protein ACPHZB_01455, partial [Flavobacteriales bacterium]